MELIAPMCHEFEFHMRANEHGLKPFFAFYRVIEQNGGTVKTSFRSDSGEVWAAKLYYQDSGIEHPGDETPSGTPFDLDTMREYRISVTSLEDDIGQRGFNVHIAPRWEGMNSKKGNDISPPKGFGDGINVRVNGSNIHFGAYENLVKQAFDAVDVNSYYLDKLEGTTVTDAARYVRIRRKRSGRIHAREGPLVGLSHLLENDREGYRKLVQNDTDNHGDVLSGFYHTVTLDPTRIREAWATHELPKEIKHYFAKEANSKAPDNPLYHPKLEAAYQRKRWDNSLDLTEIPQIIEELDDVLYSTIAESDLPINQSESGGIYFEDAYFSAKNIERDGYQITPLDLTEIRHEQESVVIKHLADGGFSPVQWESIQTLVTDGGQLSPADIAAENERHVDSVRRALNEIDDMVEREYGRVALRSSFIADLVHDAVQEAKDATRRAVEAGAKAIEGAKRNLDEHTSAFVAWAARHGIDVNDKHEARMTLRMQQIESYDELRKAVTNGYQIWTDAGRDPMRYRTAEVLFKSGSVDAYHYIVDARLE